MLHVKAFVSIGLTGNEDQGPFARVQRRSRIINCLESEVCMIRLETNRFLEEQMARYGKAASKSVRSAMRRRKHGTLRSGRSGKGGQVKSRKQAIAIGLSEARKKGAKVPRKRSS